MIPLNAQKKHNVLFPQWKKKNTHVINACKQLSKFRDFLETVGFSGTLTEERQQRYLIHPNLGHTNINLLCVLEKFKCESR